MINWRHSPLVVPLEEGTRGAGERRGEAGVAEFVAGTYPACSLHGALNRLGKDRGIWRCMVEGCNAGGETDLPWRGALESSHA